MTSVERPAPTEDEVRGYFDTCSNWGRWGPDDDAGTINLITPEKRVEASRLVRNGNVVSVSRPFNTRGGPGNLNPAQHFIRTWESACVDYIGLIFHGYSTTHLDSLCHIFWEGKMWNGKPASEVTSMGAQSGAVTAWADGITTRGILLDIPRLRGTDHITLDTPVRGWELEAAAEQEGVEVRPGDAILVYSGREKFYANTPEASPGAPPTPGLHVDTVPVLKKWDAGLLGWDCLDAGPSDYELFRGRTAGGPVHVLTIVYMGLPLLDNALLEPLAKACAEEGRWEFMFTVNPLNIPGGTGSPANPIATF